jgi:hypothetical protein
LPILQTILCEKDWDITSELSDSNSTTKLEMKDSIAGKKYSNRDEYVGISNLTLGASCNEDSTITSMTPSLTVKIPQALYGNPESNLTLGDSCNEDSTITSMTPSLTVKIPQALHGNPKKDHISIHSEKVIKILSHSGL